MMPKRCIERMQPSLDLGAFSQNMKPTYIRRAIGGTSVLLGLWWLWMVIYPVLRGLWIGGSRTDYLFSLTIVPMMLIPGILATVFGVRLFRSMSVSSLKWVVGVLVTFGVFWLSSSFSRIFPDLLPERIASSAFLFAGSLIALPAYFAALWYILPCLAADRPKLSSLVGRGVLILMAWQLWLLLSAILDEYTPIEEGYKHVPKEPWGTVGVLVPIIVAYGTYRLAAARLLTKTTEQGGGGDSASLRASP